MAPAFSAARRQSRSAVPPAGSGNPPSYEALRSKDALYVEYADGERELYDLAVDPFQLRNLADEVPPERLAELAVVDQILCHLVIGVDAEIERAAVF